MNSKTVGVGVIALLIGLAAGFLLANSLNRTEILALKAQVDRGTANPTTGQPDGGNANDLLDPEEIKAKIAQADADPENITFQKNLGGALYRYGAMRKDTALIEQAKRLLERAHALDKEDYQIIVDLGNAHFDIGYFKKDKESLKRSRELYDLALKKKPEDADVRTDLALTYFLQEPADLAKAAAEFESALRSDPKQERALQYLAQTLIRAGDFDKARESVAKLRALNPKNESIELLESQIANRKAANVQ
ncbi:MAG: tetratricopeptide repeat protein [Acidobacteria bacterium]|nr:tetratricopeptide repeat protein [Acidobacteriota bacterium]MCW5949162.1 tetratricopeptide repeat protein [Pyrinomonadaceae bacterium]